MSVEILAPAGSQESLDAAIAAGADAVYFGLPDFGARAYADNFTLEQTRKNIEKLHLAGMKAYITMNTILYEDQMEQACDWAWQLYEMGADALIVQDLGLLHLLHERIPDLELHASTQLSVTRPEQIRQLEKLGVKRVVLARECTLEQIRTCVQTGMEIEVFVHGAICISYSGQCQFSAVRYGRSGNRGACAQPCRMQYTLLEDGEPVSGEEFVLSPKDLSLIQDVQTLVEAGVVSLKIEGRMKSPAYVYESVHLLKKRLENGTLTREDEKNLRVTFSRGFTKGYLQNFQAKELMTRTTSNHLGIPAGTVLSAGRGRVKIRLSEDLKQNDGLRFEKDGFSDGCRVNFLYDAKGKLIHEARKGQTVEVRVSGFVPTGAIVVKTVDSALEKEVEQAINHTHRQIPIQGKVSCKGVGSVLELELHTLDRTVSVTSDQPAQAALNKPTDASVIQKQLEKTGDSFGYFESLDFALAPGIFFPLPVLNALRRAGLEALRQAILAVDVQPIRPYDVQLPFRKLDGILVQIQEESQKLDLQEVLFVSEFPIPGVQKKAPLNGAQGFLVSHLVPGDLIQDMNVTNSYAVAALLLLGYKGVVLSDELDLEQTRQLMEAFVTRYGFSAPVMVNVYQKRRLMLMKYCPVNAHVADGTKKNCRACHERRYELLGKDGKEAVLIGDVSCSMRIFEECPENRLSFIKDYENMGIQAFSVIFTDENVSKEHEILTELTDCFQGAILKGLTFSDKI